MLTFKRRLADEAGFVLPTAIIVTMIVTVLAGAAIKVSTQTSKSTTRDVSTKAALEAAEGGLQVASYRVNNLKPEAANCITGSAEAAPQSGSVYCASSSTESLGNSASFQYWTSKALSAGEKCAGETIEAKTGITQRCITSEGKVNGVEPATRLQTRVESSVGESLFSIKGILGLEEVLVNGSVKATSVVASNKKIIGEGGAVFEQGFEICPPEGTFKPAVGAERNSSGVTVGKVKGGYVGYPPLEITRSSGCPIEAKIPAVHATAAENEDSRIGVSDPFVIESAKSASKFTGSPKYELIVGSSTKLTLKGSKYYFCKLLLERDGELILEKGAKVEIFIDSHANNANCPVGSGTFAMEGSSKLINTNGPGSLLIEMAGPGPLSITNGASLAASIFAPEALVKLSGSGSLTGAVVGAKVKLEAGSFIFGEGAENIWVGSATGAYSRKGWEQCTSGTGASAGC
jgi:Tfp pilus assembly protein PilX